MILILPISAPVSELDFLAASKSNLNFLKDSSCFSLMLSLVKIIPSAKASGFNSPIILYNSSKVVLDSKV